MMQGGLRMTEDDLRLARHAFAVAMWHLQQPAAA
jgi:hypothetical protein